MDWKDLHCIHGERSPRRGRPGKGGVWRAEVGTPGVTLRLPLPQRTPAALKSTCRLRCHLYLPTEKRNVLSYHSDHLNLVLLDKVLNGNPRIYSMVRLM